MEDNKRDIFEFDDGSKLSDKIPNENDIPMHTTDTNDIFEDIISDTKLMKKSNKHSYHKKRRGIAKWWFRMKKWQRTTIVTVTSILLVLGIAAGVFFTMFDYNYNNISTNPEDLGFENVIDNKIINIALFGIDARDKNSFKGLSDSIMILSINTETKKIKIISVMRDSLVPIRYDGKTTYNKINSAYSKGGPELAIKTLNEIFKLDISEYATVNFYGMTDIIDAVDGIDVNIVKGEIDVMGTENGHSINYGINGMIQEQCAYMGLDPEDYYITREGEQHLNGIQAVAYSRIRHAANAEGTNNDQGRTDRQRYVMEQLFNKAVKLSKSQYIKLAKALIPCSETSLTYTQIINLAASVLLHSPSFEQTRVPLYEYQMTAPSDSGVGSCIYYDLDYASKIIKAFIYDDIQPEDYIEQNGVEKNDWFHSKSAGKNNSSVSGSNSGSSKINDYDDTSSNNSSGSSSDSSYDTSSRPSSKPSTSSGSTGNESSESSSAPTNSNSSDTSSDKPSSSTPSDSTSSSEEPPEDTNDTENLNSH